jgi:ferric-chelate reductase [NAD(P)H]
MLPNVLLVSEKRWAMAETLSPGGTEETRTEHGDVGAALDEMPYGVYIIGTVREGDANGMIADWVMQVAFRPPCVLVSFENDSYSLASIRQNSAFTVNLLARAKGAGMALAQHFVQPHLAEKVIGRSPELARSTYQKLEAVDYVATTGGLPVLNGALMWLECVAQQFIDAGDHTLVIGRALDGKVLASDEPLTSADIPWPYSGTVTRRAGL